MSFPALQTAGKPFVRIVSCNPLEIRGAAGARDPAAVLRACRPTTGREWEAFREEYDRTHRPTWEDFDAWCREQGTAPLPELEFEHTSPRPEPLRLPAGRRLHRPPPARRGRGAGSTRRSGRPTPRSSCPAELADRPAGSALIYLSLGSLGSADVDADAAARRGPRRHAAPLHRLEGPAARRATSSPRTCGAPSSCPRRRSCRSSTS